MNIVIHISPLHFLIRITLTQYFITLTKYARLVLSESAYAPPNIMNKTGTIISPLHRVSEDTIPLRASLVASKWAEVRK